MSTSLLDRITGKRSKARQQLDALAKREAAGTATPKDEAALVDLLEATRTSEDEYRSLVRVATRHAELAREGAKLPDAKAAHAEARAALDAEDLRWREARDEHEARRRELLITLGDAGAARQRAQRCAWEAEQLESEHPGLFDKPVPDLDACTLCYADNTIVHHDPGAPRLQVACEMFNRESERRNRISAAARKRAIAEYQASKAEWLRSLPNDYRGDPIFGPDDTFSTFTPPTWRDIVERGWHRQLDTKLDGVAA